MTEHPTTNISPTPADDASAAARQARVADLGRGRGTKRRHPAQGARIAAAGIGTATMLGLVGLMGYAAHPTSATAPAPAPVAQPQIVVVVHRAGAPDPVATNVGPSTSVAPSAQAATTVTARPTVKPASRQAQAPAASTSGSK